MCFFYDALLKVKTERKTADNSWKIIEYVNWKNRKQRSIVIYSTADHVTEALEQQNCPRRQLCLNLSVFFLLLLFDLSF